MDNSSDKDYTALWEKIFKSVSEVKYLQIYINICISTCLVRIFMDKMTLEEKEKRKDRDEGS